jgi:hypothetical protein
MIPRRRQGRGVDSSLTWAPANVSALNAPVGGASMDVASPRGSRGCPAPERGRSSPKGGDRPSSEAEPHPRRRPALERGGTSLEGVSSPRARQILTQGGRPALERGGTSPEETSGPRARRNLARGGVQPSSETEVCQCRVVPLERSGVLLEGGWAICLVGRRGHQSCGPGRWAVSLS